MAKRKEYGVMCSYNTAVTWIRNLKDVDENIKARVLSRMEYEMDKSTPVKPKFHKGKYGKRYDTYTCGHCGFGIDVITSTYCNNCGFAIDKTDLR